MYLIHDRRRISFGTVETAQARWLSATIRRGIPVRNADILKSAAELRTNAARKIISKSFAHCAGFRTRPESGNLIVLNRMAVLVPDHFRILGVVHATRPIADLFRAW